MFGPRGLSVLFLVVAGCQAAPEGEVTFQALSPAEAPPRGLLRVEGVSPSDVEDARVEVRVGTAPGLPAMLGTTRHEGDLLVFEPRFPFASDLDYAVTLRVAGDVLEETLVRFPGTPLPATTRIDRIYPSAPVLPANVLKFYLHFSAPMRRSEAYRHVSLRDEGGQMVEGVLLELETELWDPETRRLTLLFDPGRIKRGLRLRREMGPTLHPDRRYTLVVDPAWCDARGGPLAEGFEHSFRTLTMDEASPEPERWCLESPAAGTHAPLVVRFDEPLDRAQLEHALEVHGDTGELPGRSEVEEGELVWRFTPRGPWPAGGYRVVVDPLLEDRCGNGLRRPFEVALDEPRSGDQDAPVVLPFEVVSAGTPGQRAGGE